MHYLVVKSLNPYFDGSISVSNLKFKDYEDFRKCLNPYFDGSISVRFVTFKVHQCSSVLILILMEVSQ